MIVSDKVRDTITSGATFGELALLNDSPRLATIRTRTDTACWALDRSVFRMVLKRINKSRYEEISRFVE